MLQLPKYVYLIVHAFVTAVMYDQKDRLRSKFSLFFPFYYSKLPHDQCTVESHRWSRAAAAGLPATVPTSGMQYR